MMCPSVALWLPVAELDFRDFAEMIAHDRQRHGLREGRSVLPVRLEKELPVFQPIAPTDSLLHDRIEKRNEIRNI